MAPNFKQSTQAERPRIKLERRPIDTAIELLGVALILLSLVFPALHFAELPERIPMHYDVNGQPDSFGSKNSIWVLPAVAALLFIAIYGLNRYPHLYNYPVKITPENAAKQYRRMTTFLRLLNTAVAGLFFYLSFTTVRTALGQQSGLSPYLLPGIMIGSTLFLLVCLVLALRDKSGKT